MTKRSFIEGTWNTCIDVSDFIKKNYTPYSGDASVLSSTTERTDRVRKRVEELLIEGNGVSDFTWIAE